MRLHCCELGVSFIVLVVLFVSFSALFVAGVDLGFLDEYPSKEYALDKACFDGCVEAENACRDEADAEYSLCDPIRAGFGGNQEQYNCYVEYRKKTLLANDFRYEGEPEEGTCAVEAKECIISSCIKKKPALETCGKGQYQSAEDYCNPFYGDAMGYSYSSCIDVCGKKDSEQAIGDNLAEEVARATSDYQTPDTRIAVKDEFFNAYEDTEARFAGEPPVPAGSIEQLRGTVEVQQRDGTWKKLSKGDEINSLDRIRTSGDGRLRILLKDGTLFTLGGGSDLIIDEFIYDPNAKTEFSASLWKGIFRWVTKNVANKAPSRVNFRVPSADIGIRGTDFIASYDPETDLTEVHVKEGVVFFTSTETGQTTEFGEGSSAYAYSGEVASVEPLSEEDWKFFEDGVAAEIGDLSVVNMIVVIIINVLFWGLLAAGGYYGYKKFFRKK